MHNGSTEGPRVPVTLTIKNVPDRLAEKLRARAAGRTGMRADARVDVS